VHLRRAIRQAQARGKVIRNVADLVTTPKGKKRKRPSKALTKDQANAVEEQAKRTPWYAYVAVSLMTGIHTE
jgi:integrase